MKTFRLILILLLLGLMVSYTQPASAQQSSSEIALCQRIETASLNSQKSMNNHRTSVGASKPYISTAEAKKYEQIRNRADELRRKHFESIIGKLKSDQQKQAIKKYQSDLDAAINKRRVSIVATQKQFVESAQELHSLHQTEVAKLESEFANQITAAFNQAKSACNEGGNSLLVRQKLSYDIQQVKQSFAKNKVNLAQNSQKYRQLLENRNQEISKALNEFRRSELQAKQELVSSLQTK